MHICKGFLFLVKFSCCIFLHCWNYMGRRHIVSSAWWSSQCYLCML